MFLGVVLDMVKKVPQKWPELKYKPRFLCFWVWGTSIYIYFEELVTLIFSCKIFFCGFLRLLFLARCFIYFYIKYNLDCKMYNYF